MEETPADEKKRKQIVKGLDKMVSQGRMTEAEAEALRETDDPNAFEILIRRLRVRHVTVALSAAVEAGHMSQSEADENLQRLSDGEHPRSLRAHLSKMIPRDH